MSSQGGDDHAEEGDHEDADEELVDAEEDGHGDADEEVVDVGEEAVDVGEAPAARTTVFWRPLQPHDRVRALVATGGTN